PASWKPLAEVARLADPDPWRNRLRDALLSADRDRTLLRELGDTADLAAQPPESLWHLYLLLIRHDPGGATAFLVKAQRPPPDSIALNSALGSAFRHGFGSPWRPDEAVRFHAAAIALAPRSPGMHYNLGLALADLGRDDEAIAAFDDAI